MFHRRSTLDSHTRRPSRARRGSHAKHGSQHSAAHSEWDVIAVNADRPGEVLTGGYAAAGPASTTAGTATGATPGRAKGAATPANGTAGATGAAKGTAGATGAATGAAGATGATGTARAAGAAPAGCTAAGAGTLKVTPLVRSSRSKAEPLKSRAPRIASCTVFLLLPSSYVPSIRRAAHSSRVGSSHRNTRMSSSRAAGQAYGAPLRGSSGGRNPSRLTRLTRVA